METDNMQNMPQRPQLKKVKRPINRMPTPVMSNPAQQTPMSPQQQVQQPAPRPAAPQGPSLNNPFVSKTSSDDAFNLDAYLDEAIEPKQESNTLPRRFLGEDELVKEVKKQQQEAPEYFEEEGEPLPFVSDVPPYMTKKILILLGAVLFFLGIITAKILFAEEKIVRNGLQGVVVNPEVPKGRARCGVAERTQGCVLYVMNPQRQEMSARDFYDLASQMTGRQRFVIETGNMRYSNTKIRPGDIAQFNIPPL